MGTPRPEAVYRSGPGGPHLPLRPPAPKDAHATLGRRTPNAESNRSRETVRSREEARREAKSRVEATCGASRAGGWKMEHGRSAASTRQGPEVEPGIAEPQANDGLKITNTDAPRTKNDGTSKRPTKRGVDEEANAQRANESRNGLGRKATPEGDYSRETTSPKPSAEKGRKRTKET